MGTIRKIRIGILTSSRADFGIYLPLLKAIRQDEAFSMKMIVFGTHLSPHHGYTLNEIIREGFDPTFKISSMLIGDEPGAISSSYAVTALKFADFWDAHHVDFDIVFCLGDRFEMAAAVTAAIPFGVGFAHLHGGETSLGAIDNIYRHSITLASKMHFVSADPFKDRIRALTGDSENCFVMGALSLDNLDSIRFLDAQEFENRWAVDITQPFVLVTIHPETVSYKKNEIYIQETYKALGSLVTNRSLIITMPNADTNGSLYRLAFQKLKMEFPDKVHLIENFGTQSYFTCMKSADYLLGNTSSGIIEAASLKKFVINLGDRQKGRLSSENVMNVPFESHRILEAASKISGKVYEGKNIFKVGNASNIIIETIKQKFNATL